METKPKGIPFPFFRNSCGKPDGMWTLCVWATMVALACKLLGGSSLTLGGAALRVPEINGAEMIAVLTFVAGYVVRRRDSGKGVGA